MIDDYDYFDNKLPKRDDDIYKEIEAFEDYEYTNCIAFEMAIRNKEVKKLLDKSHLFREVEKAEEDAINIYFDNILPNAGERKDFIYELSKYGFNYVKCSYYNLAKNMKRIKGDKLGSKILTQPERTKLTDILSEGELDIVCAVEINIYNQMPWVKTEKDKMDTNQDFLEMGNHLEWSFHETNEEIIKDALKRQQKIKIENEFSRPILELPCSELADIQINLSLPKDELIAYISKVKDDFDKDSPSIKSPLKFLGEELSKSNLQKQSKKLISDKFYIYDYVTERLRQIKYMNEQNELKYNEKIAEIKTNIYLTGGDKKIQTQELKKEMNNDKINTNINTIFTEIKGFTASTAKRYFYDIKPFIDDLKYKELVTGTSNNDCEYEKTYSFEIKEVKNKT